MIPVLGVPVMNGLNLMKLLLLSIDFPIHTLVFVHNMDSGQPNFQIAQWLNNTKLNPPTLVKHVEVHTYSSNLGCSAAWNTIMLKNRSPWWLIANSDISFYPQMLKLMSHHVNETLHKGVCVWKFFGYSLFGISAHSLNTVGTFDENFWPCYAEDCDYQFRIEQSVCQTSSTPSINVKHFGSSTYKSEKNSKLFKRITQRDSGFNNLDYLVKKWGKNVCNDKNPTNINKNDNNWVLDIPRRVKRGGSESCVACKYMGNFNSNEEKFFQILLNLCYLCFVFNLCFFVIRLEKKFTLPLNVGTQNVKSEKRSEREV